MMMGEIKFYNPDSYENIPYDKDGPHSPECIQEFFNHLSLFEIIRFSKFSSWSKIWGVWFSHIKIDFFLKIWNFWTRLVNNRKILKCFGQQFTSFFSLSNILYYIVYKWELDLPWSIPLIINPGSNDFQIWILRFLPTKSSESEESSWAKLRKKMMRFCNIWLYYSHYW